MREVVIRTGVYGRRTAHGRVAPVSKGERVTLSDEEAARLADLGIAVYADAAEAPAGSSSEPSSDIERAPEPPSDSPDAHPAGEAGTDSGEKVSSDVDIVRLERMPKLDLEQMAADLGVNISRAKTKHDLAMLIAAAGEAEDGEAPPNLDTGDIVR